MKLSPLPEATFLPPNLSQFLSPPLPTSFSVPAYGHRLPLSLQRIPSSSFLCPLRTDLKAGLTSYSYDQDGEACQLSRDTCVRAAEGEAAKEVQVSNIVGK